MSRRIQKIEKQIHQIVAQYIVTHFNGELSGFVSVSKIIVSGDLKKAKVFVTSYGEKPDENFNLQFLSDQAYKIQKQIAKEIRMRFCPKLYFFNDDQVNKVISVENLINKLESQRS